MVHYCYGMIGEAVLEELLLTCISSFETESCWSTIIHVTPKSWFEVSNLSTNRCILLDVDDFQVSTDNYIVDANNGMRAWT